MSFFFVDFNFLCFGIIDLVMQTTPGLSSYADDPTAAAQSLKTLLENAEAIVPEELRANTPVLVGVSDSVKHYVCS